MIIGLSGWARSGKDTIGDYLVSEYGFEKHAFADKMRESLYRMDPIVSYGWYVGGARWHNQYVRLSNIIDRVGWDGYKETQFGPEIRRLLQYYGTEGGRETLGENVWVDALFDNINWRRGQNIVVTDVRYPNEATEIKARGGSVWRVARPGIRPAGEHASEHSLDDWNFEEIILNNGSIRDLYFKIDKHMELDKVKKYDILK